VVVGAGMAGLTAARRLSGRHEVVVLDKSRGVGGRMATRRVGGATIDHGAQFLTAHTEDFARTLAELEGAGAVAGWFHSLIGPDGAGQADGHTRYRGVRSMNDVAKYLATGLDVRRGAPVRSVARAGGAWRIEGASGVLEADAVLLTAPVPQSLEVLDAGGTVLSALDRSALEKVSYDPCIAVLAPLDGPSGLPPPGAVDPVEGPIDWMADNHAKGVSAVSAVTIHATPAASYSMWDSPDELVVAELLDAAGLDSPVLRELVQVQRWRYSRPVCAHPHRYMLAASEAPLSLAGDAFGGARVEGAALSGAAAAAAIDEALGGPP
jgi:renalase